MTPNRVIGVIGLLLYMHSFVMDDHYVQSHIASCEARTYVVHNPASKVASFLGLPTVQFLIACSTPKLDGGKAFKGTMRWIEVQHSRGTRCMDGSLATCS